MTEIKLVEQNNNMNNQSTNKNVYDFIISQIGQFDNLPLIPEPNSLPQQLQQHFCYNQCMEFTNLINLQKNILSINEFNSTLKKHFQQILFGLNLLHKNQFYHGDLKISSILTSIVGTPQTGVFISKISNFKYSKSNQNGSQQSNSNLGQDYTPTILFNNLEGQNSQFDSFQLDIYCAAVIFCNAITQKSFIRLQHDFIQSEKQDLFWLIIKKQMDKPQEFEGLFTSCLRSIIWKMLTSQYQNVDQILQEQLFSDPAWIEVLPQ